MAVTEEDIKKMSPEQLREFQKQQCIFCHIVAKRVQSRIIYEDDKVLGVLDINPANPGHILLLPKEHYSVSPQMPDELFAHMGQLAKQLSKVLLRTVGAEGTTIIASNGMAAGQRASHFIMHIIPRKEGDNVGIMVQPGEITEAQIMQVQTLLAPLIGKAFGREPVKIEALPEKPRAEPPAPKAEPKPAPEPPKETVKPAPKDEGTNLDDITSFLLGGK